MAQAEVVLQYAPELADQVLAGGSLNDAYAEALRRKQLPEREAERKRQAESARKADEDRRMREEERLRQAIQLAMEEIGPEVPISASGRWLWRRRAAWSKLDQRFVRRRLHRG